MRRCTRRQGVESQRYRLQIDRNIRLVRMPGDSANAPPDRGGFRIGTTRAFAAPERSAVCAATSHTGRAAQARPILSIALPQAGLSTGGALRQLASPAGSTFWNFWSKDGSFGCRNHVKRPDRQSRSALSGKPATCARCSKRSNATSTASRFRKRRATCSRCA